MNQQQYFEFHKAMCDEARELSKAKNDDYASPEDRHGDPMAIFGNFMQCKHLNICEVEQGFLVRLSDKFSRLCNILRPGHVSGVKDEALEDTLKDIINYCLLLGAYIKTVDDLAYRDRVSEAAKGLSNLPDNVKRSEEMNTQEHYPWIKRLGVKLNEADEDSPVGVDMKSLVEALEANNLDVNVFNALFGCQTCGMNGPYPWDVEAVLHRMMTGEKTVTQLCWD